MSSLVSVLLFYTVTEHSVMVSARGCPGSTCISPVWLERCKLSLSTTIFESALCGWIGVILLSVQLRTIPTSGSFCIRMFNARSVFDDSWFLVSMMSLGCVRLNLLLGFARGEREREITPIQP